MAAREKNSELVDVEIPLSDAQNLYYLISGEPRPTIKLTRRELADQNRQGFVLLGTITGLAATVLFSYHALTSNSLQDFYQPFSDTLSQIKGLRFY